MLVDVASGGVDWVRLIGSGVRSGHSLHESGSGESLQHGPEIVSDLGLGHPRPLRQHTDNFFECCRPAEEVPEQGRRSGEHNGVGGGGPEKEQCIDAVSNKNTG